MTNETQTEKLCNGCFTEWIKQGKECQTCKELEEHRLNKLSEFITEVNKIL